MAMIDDPRYAEALRRVIARAIPPCVAHLIPHAPYPKQAAFLIHEGREALYGGAGGGGKTDALLMDAIRYACVPGYAAALFRQTYPQMTRPGQFRDRSLEWFSGKATYSSTDRQWTFDSGATLMLGYIERDADRFGWAGPELQYVGWDELTNWPTDRVYRFISFSRSRRPAVQCGVCDEALVRKSPAHPWQHRDTPLVEHEPEANPATIPPACPTCKLTLADVPLRTRAGTNPGGPGHEWVKTRFVDPWQQRLDAGSKGLLERPFFPARLDDNPHIDRNEYRASLADLDPVDRARIEAGDWTIRETGDMFERSWFQIVDSSPRNGKRVRYWDMAGSEAKPGKDPDWSVGVRMLIVDGRYWIEDVVRFRAKSYEAEQIVLQTAQLDGRDVQIVMEQEPGSSGPKVIADFARRVLVGYAFRGEPASTSKTVRAVPLASAGQAGNLFLVNGPWCEPFITECTLFPQPHVHDDQVDAASGALMELAGLNRSGRGGLSS